MNLKSCRDESSHVNGRNDVVAVVGTWFPSAEANSGLCSIMLLLLLLLRPGARPHHVLVCHAGSNIAKRTKVCLNVMASLSAVVVLSLSHGTTLPEKS